MIKLHQISWGKNKLVFQDDNLVTIFITIIFIICFLVNTAPIYLIIKISINILVLMSINALPFLSVVTFLLEKIGHGG